nr:zinc finger CCCH domain-containing protein 22-like isoform X5 [Physcomitrium patens]|eukprot:XP_024380340.1 zinc finger CCCH domain-containing protein 22-like isoform X5 [Physcomitrella patens]
MDSYEATRIVYGRVQALEPETGSKIMLHLLLQEHGEREMVRLALGSNVLIQSVVKKAKKELGLEDNRDVMPLQHNAPLYIPDHDFASGSFGSNVLSSPSLHDQVVALQQQQQNQHHNQLFLQEQLPLHDQMSSLSDAFDRQNSLHAFYDHYYPETYAFLNSSKEFLHSRSSSSRASLAVDSSSSPDLGPALAWKPCLYFARGYCKHGSSCRFLHGSLRESSGSPASSNGHRELRMDDGMAPGSLERLEIELQELLRGRRAPVSIASLPQLYYERFGKTLQAEGYLTESQRHGKAGYSLTKLLARLKNTVTLIDSGLLRHKHTAGCLNRPHGQHAVVLAEDAHRFTAYRSDHRGEDLSGINPSSRQIYLTFPAESTFTEEDVTAHFRAYGPVQDVRIPYQQKRMFGFVTFVYSETVKAILSEGNPHYICGARVLVKPYREKGKHGDRKNSERADHARFVQSRSIDGKDYHSIPKFYEEEEAFTRRLEEEEELERRRLAELHLVDVQRRREEADATMAVVAAQNRALANTGFSTDDLGLSDEGLSQFHPSNSFGYLLDVLDGGEPGDEIEPAPEFFGSKQTSGNGHNLPESPFTSPLGMSKQKVFALPEKLSNLSLQSSQVALESILFANFLSLKLSAWVCFVHVLIVNAILV